MRLFKWTIELLSGGLTPWQSDTIFGHICWQLMEADGPDALAEALAACRQGKPPFIFSNGFPSGFLPAPCGGDYILKKENLTKAEAVAGLAHAKRIKKAACLPVAAFEEIASGGRIQGLGEELPVNLSWPVVHNTIHREHGATVEGGLFTEIEAWTPALDVFLLVENGWEERLNGLLRRLELKGYGAKASRGKGSFKTVSFAPHPGFGQLEGATGFITLSRCLPSPDMPAEAQYRMDIKYGKIGGGRAAENPFKRPVIMLEPGAVFWTEEPLRPWYGRVAEGVHPAYPDTVQCGMTVAVPCRIARPAGWEALHAGGV